MNTTTTPRTRFARRGTVTRTRMVGALVGLSIGITGLGLTACGSESSTPRYENLSYAGENPFTPPVGSDDPTVKPVTGAEGEQGGDTGGLYAQNPEAPPCDPQELIANLQADQAKASAWAEVLGLEVSEIAAFAKSLTPVVLRADTAVTNYSYVDGTYRATPAVLAPGTAVFVNAYGEPTVKCYSGNPLTRATGATPGATVVVPSGTQIRVHTFVNPTSGQPVTTPGKPDPRPNPGPNPTPTDPELIKDAVKARIEADAAKQAARDATTAATIADRGLREAKDHLATLRQEQLELLRILNDPTKPLAERLAAHQKLNDPGPTGLSARIIAADKEVGTAATIKDKADAAKAEADKEAAQTDEIARQKEKDAGLKSPPPFKPAQPAQPNQNLQADNKAAEVDGADAADAADPADKAGDEQAGDEQAADEADADKGDKVGDGQAGDEQAGDEQAGDEQAGQADGQEGAGAGG